MMANSADPAAAAGAKESQRSFNRKPVRWSKTLQLPCGSIHNAALVAMLAEAISTGIKGERNASNGRTANSIVPRPQVNAARSSWRNAAVNRAPEYQPPPVSGTSLGSQRTVANRMLPKAIKARASQSTQDILATRLNRESIAPDFWFNSLSAASSSESRSRRGSAFARPGSATGGIRAGIGGALGARIPD